MAEREGFEPSMGCPKPHFECGAIDQLGDLSIQKIIVAYDAVSNC